MEFQTLRLQAQEKLKVADHLVDTTYPLVKEPKLLVSVIDNIVAAMELSVTSVLEYEKELKYISHYDSNFSSKLEIFRRKIIPKYGMKTDFLELIEQIRKIQDEHKNSTTEFKKKGNFIISDNDYNLTMLSIDNVKKILSQSKHGIEELFKIMKYG